MDENKVNGSENTDEEQLSEEELELREEMDELARTFQQELDKAKAEEELLADKKEQEHEMLIQELEDDVAFDSEEPEEIPPEELCQCCGEKRRGTKDNPDSPYCRDCERGLRRYPFELLNVLIVLIILAASVFACIHFAKRADVYAICARAENQDDEHKLSSAYGSYQSAVSLMQEREINGELVYQRAARNLLMLNLRNEENGILQYESQFKSFELKLPHLRSAYETFVTFEGFRITELDGYEILSEEVQKIEKAGGDYKDLPYAEIIGRLDALLSVSTEESYKYQQSLAEEADSAPEYPVKVEHYNEAMINFLKFYAAAVSGQDKEVQAEYLEKIRAAYPELTWMYSAFLGDIYTKTGKDVTELCQQIESYNVEDETSDVIRTAALRISGDYNESIALAQKNIDKGSSYKYEFLRQQAICYLMKGDNGKAYDAAKAAYEEYSYSVQVCETFALCALANGKTESFDEIAKLFEDNGLTLSDAVLGFRDGTVSVSEIFAQGEYDLV